MITKLKQSPLSTSPHPPVWAISDGRPGNARQAEALADALLPGQTKTLHLYARAPWRWASPRRLPASGQAFGTAFSRMILRPPTSVVGCGRQAALATRLLREAGSQVVQILDPRISHRHWDWVVVPAHDGVDGTNVLPVRGSLNPVDDAWLAAARVEFAWLDTFPGPRLTMLVGGDSRHGRLPASVGASLLDLLRRWPQDTGGSVFVTNSRRTPPGLTAALVQKMQGRPGLCWTGANDSSNPYPGILAFADQIVCTADSVNLLSEACATRVPVCIVGAEMAQGGPGRFARDLIDSARAQTTLFAPSLDVTPLRETARIAALLRQRLKITAPASPLAQRSQH